MSDRNALETRFPLLGEHFRREKLAVLPTPVIERRLKHKGSRHTLHIKCDDQTGEIYGGNKTRKLEYLLHKARARNRKRVATFGAVGSHHALATALYAHKLGFGSTCFLSHQKRVPSIAEALDMHLRNDTEIVRFGGNYAKRIATLRKYLWNRGAWVIPAGGSSWLGAIGFVNAGLELAGQVEAGELPQPDRIYVAAGTLGTVAGLAIGLALAGLATEVHAVRVTEPAYSGADLLDRLLRKTLTMMQMADPTLPSDLSAKLNIRLRHSFFGAGYAHSDAATDLAVELARDELGLSLECTYTGKTMAALLADLAATTRKDQQILFWNTYSSVPMQESSGVAPDDDRLPAAFRSYYS